MNEETRERLPTWWRFPLDDDDDVNDDDDDDNDATKRITTIVM